MRLQTNRYRVKDGREEKFGEVGEKKTLRYRRPWRLKIRVRNTFMDGEIEEVA